MRSEVEVLKEKIIETLDILGEFKYYDVPTYEQNDKNSDIVTKAYNLLDSLVEREDEDD